MLRKPELTIVKATSECRATDSVVGWLPDSEDVTFHIWNMETWKQWIGKNGIKLEIK